MRQPIQTGLGVCIYRFSFSSSEPLREPVHETRSEICYLLESRNLT